MNLGFEPLHCVNLGYDLETPGFPWYPYIFVKCPIFKGVCPAFAQVGGSGSTWNNNGWEIYWAKEGYIKYI